MVKDYPGIFAVFRARESDGPRDPGDVPRLFGGSDPRDAAPAGDKGEAEFDFDFTDADPVILGDAVDYLFANPVGSQAAAQRADTGAPEVSEEDGADLWDGGDFLL